MQSPRQKAPWAYGPKGKSKGKGTKKGKQDQYGGVYVRGGYVAPDHVWAMESSFKQNSTTWWFPPASMDQLNEGGGMFRPHPLNLQVPRDDVEELEKKNVFFQYFIMRCTCNMDYCIYDYIDLLDRVHSLDDIRYVWKVIDYIHHINYIHYIAIPTDCIDFSSFVDCIYYLHKIPILSLKTSRNVCIENPSMFARTRPKAFSSILVTKSHGLWPCIHLELMACLEGRRMSFKVFVYGFMGFITISHHRLKEYLFWLCFQTP